LLVWKDNYIYHKEFLEVTTIITEGT
jgi:hypothetical protein